MRIAVDAREFKKGANTGLRTILRDFLKHSGDSGHDIICLCNQYTDIDAIPYGGEKIVLTETITFLWDHFTLPRALKRAGADVFFSIYIKTPFWRVCPYVNTISDIIPLTMPKRGGLSGLAEKVYFYICSLISGHRAAMTITLSETSKTQVCRVFGIHSDKVEVVYPSVDLQKFSSLPDAEKERILGGYRLGEPYMLYAGNFKPHKNLERMVKAYSLLPSEIRENYRLMLVGGSAAELENMKEIIRSEGLTGRVGLVGSIPHADISVFMENASVFVFPSIAEGFGIPPVEAMSFGVPVLASGIEPMTEVLGEAARFFDPYDAGDIARAIKENFLSDGERDRIIMKGHERASFFDSRRMSKNMLRVIEDAGREKALFISSEYPPVKGGISTVFFNLFTRMPPEKTVLLTSCPGGGVDPELDKGFDVVRKVYPLGSNMAARVIRTISVVTHMCGMNRRRNIAHNHCGQVMSAGPGGLISKKMKRVGYTVYVYSADILEFSRNFFTRKMMGYVLRESDRVVANSNFTKRVLLEKNLVDDKKIVVLTPAVDAEEFSPDRGYGEVRALHGISSASRILLSVSRLAPRKGQDTVIRAVREVCKTFPSLVYLIVGEGTERARLKEIARDNGVEEKVIFAGEVSGGELVHYYNSCDIFIMLPRYIPEKGDVEGFGMVFLEANACGKPVIAGRTGGVEEAVADGETGILVDPENVREVVEAIKKLFSDGEYSRGMGLAGRRRILRDFSWGLRAEKIRETLTHVERPKK